MLDLVLLFIAVVLIFALLVIFHIRIVPESEAWVMERLGVYSRTWHTGLHIKVPFIERRRDEPIDLREQILVVGKSQPVITKDNVSIDIDTVVFYQITDPKLFVYGHKTPIIAIEHLAATTLRNLVGELELDETLSSRDTINAKLRVVLDEATDAWGIRVTRVELKNIIISDKELADAMEKQMIAERTRRANVIEAEGIRKSAILVAEGKKQAAILEAEGAKQATILAAEAKREADICEGEGEAERILLVQQATAEGIKMVNASEPSKEVLTIKSLQALEEAAKGESNTIIIPSEIQGLAGLAKSASEIFKA
jgi:regulator of protease activity HflC (stomatin/prohibitin superfamily)